MPGVCFEFANGMALHGVSQHRWFTTLHAVRVGHERLRGMLQPYSRPLRRTGLPYFRNLTSLCHLLLCHLLMDLGFDCAKPDSAGMKAAVGLAIVPRRPNS